MRLTTIAASAAVLALTAGGMAVAVADPKDEPNFFGLCTAYMAGSEKGQEEKRKAPPFQGLEAAAESWAAENGHNYEGEDAVAAYCEEYGGDENPSGKAPGKPE